MPLTPNQNFLMLPWRFMKQFAQNARIVSGKRKSAQELDIRFRHKDFFKIDLLFKKVAHYIFFQMT